MQSNTDLMEDSIKVLTLAQPLGKKNPQHYQLILAHTNSMII